MSAIVVKGNTPASSSISVASCAACNWVGTPSDVRFFAEADVRNHNAKRHGSRRLSTSRSVLTDGDASDIKRAASRYAHAVIDNHENPDAARLRRAVNALNDVIDRFVREGKA